MKTTRVALRLTPEQFAVGALKLIALREVAKQADLTLQYSQVALAVGIIADVTEWADNAKRAKARTDLSALFAVTAAIGVTDDDFWRRIVDQDGKQGAGFYRHSYIVTEEHGARLT
jgi:hypothetical protein